METDDALKDDDAVSGEEAVVGIEGKSASLIEGPIEDGGVIVKEVSNDVVHIKYQGACGSCSKSQSGTLVAIQGILQKNLSPELQVIVT